MTDEQLIASLAAKEHGFTHVRDAAEELWQSHAASEAWKLVRKLFAAPEYQQRMCAVFLLGRLAVDDPGALAFLRDEVARDDNWRVQEVLAQAFDYYCRQIGYEAALPTIEDWLGAKHPNTCRAVTEGLRVWTKRPYFREHPDMALALINTQRKADNDNLRRSAGNALRDIKRTHPDL